jgi:hypothetical protein
MAKVKLMGKIVTLPTIAQIKKDAKSKASVFDSWILPFIPVGLALVQANLTNPAFVKKYKKILTSIVTTADIIRPFVEE